MKKILLIIMAIALLTSCQQQSSGEVSISSPFLGGTQGLEISFQDFRAEVFDGGQDPFDIVVQVENKGEAEVKQQNAEIQLSGINPFEFGKNTQFMQKNLPDDIIARQKTESQTIESPPTYVEFTGLNHIDKIIGSSAEFPIRAEICYLYETTAVGKLCIREKLLNPEEGGICDVSGSKPIFTSSAPVQIRNLQQQVRSKDKIGFSFEIYNAGTGDIYERTSKCDKQVRARENKVYVDITTGLPGVECTGLTNGKGMVTIYDGSKTITCTQRAETSTDFEQMISINLEYDYEQLTSTTLKVKSSGEE